MTKALPGVLFLEGLFYKTFTLLNVHFSAITVVLNDVDAR